jgi:steroid delta-isomerase-like uncharacterized protein
MAAYEIATLLVEAFNDADWDAFRAGLKQDAVYVESGTGRRVEGADAYVDLCRAWKEAFPDVRGVVHRSLESTDTVAQEVTWSGTHTGPLPTPDGVIPASGQRVSVDATLWVTVRDGGAAEVHHHLDVMALMAQIGALATA